MAKKINHSARKHAILSASGASRWLNCTPSPRLEENFANTTSVYAEEGTLAHEISELMISVHPAIRFITPNVYIKELAKLKKNELFQEDMLFQLEKYVDIVIEKYNQAVADHGSAELLLEQRLDFSHIVPDGFGTGDVCIIADKTLIVIDLKYGKGIEVSAVENSQLMLYGSGALRKYDLAYEIDTVELNIIQPRKDNYSTWEISAQDLITWGEDYVKPLAEKAHNGEGEQRVGDWCKFCKAQPICRALAEENMKLARHEFRDPQLLEKDEVFNIYKQIDLLTDWAKEIKTYVLDQALKGHKWPEHKLVEGKSNRKFVKPEAIQKLLLSKGYELSEFTKSSLVGIGDMEKLIPKTDFNKLLGDYIVKPPGAPALVHESDKRPAMGLEQAKADFGD